MLPKFDLLDEAYPGSTQLEPTIALLPAGGEVWEDFLDSIGVSLERFCHEGPGGWMLGYIDALSRAGVRTVLIFFSGRITSPMRFRDAASGSIISVLPAPRHYLALRQKLINSRTALAESAGNVPRYKRKWRQSVLGLLNHVAPYLSTPLRLLSRELRREGCRAILCQEYEYFRFDTCVLLGRLLRLPVFATFQGNDFERNPISRALRPFAVRHCDGLFVAPGTEIERVRNHYKLPPERVAQIFNPVDLGMWGMVDRDQARAAFNLPPSARIAVWHGRIAIESKGLDILLDAWEQVCRERPGQDLRLLMMGTGQDAGQMRQRVEALSIPNVQWIDEYVTDRNTIRRLLSAGDVYAFPSRYEGFAVAPIEAMACSLPVVAAQASGIPDIFERGEASGGIVVPRGDTAAFAQALGRALDDQPFSRELGRLARQRVEQAFSLEAVGLQLGSFLLPAGSSSSVKDQSALGQAAVKASSDLIAMDAYSRYRPKILPVPEGVQRPLWSVMIPTYNCANYLRETLAGVLAQDPGPELMQIEVVDDCSTRDDPEAVVAELGRGRVRFYRQPRNLGHVGNFNTCLQRSDGQIVHLLHGDDYVGEGFYAGMGRLFEQHPQIGAAFCRHTIVDEHGNVQRISPLEQPASGVLQGWLERIASELPLQPPSVVVRREAYERVGGFDRRMLSCGEDWEMWVRIALHYPVGYEPEMLAFYRDNSNSLTKRSIRNGQNIRDVRKATQIIRTYLPRSIAREATRKASESWANWALHWAAQLIANGDTVGAAVQIREGLLCSHSQRIVQQAAPMIIKIGKRWGKRAAQRAGFFKRGIV